MKKIKNAAPQRYRMYFITPGLADYTAEGIGAVLVQKPALDKMSSTFVGKPIVNLEHTDKDPEELFQSLKNGANPEEFADGVISAVGYDEASGWYWADGIVWDEETQKNMNNGYSVSCAYDVKEMDDSGGTYNNIGYSEEVLDGEYVHMAIVENPRYERAYIIKNSKGVDMKVKFLRKKNATPPPAPEKEEDEVVENAADGVVDIDGKQVSLAELIAAYQEEKEEEGPEMMNEADEVELENGEKVTVGELINAYKNKGSMENAESPIDEPAEEVVDETLQNAKPKKNENFRKVQNAAHGEAPSKREINTETVRLNRGKARYGTPVAQGGK